ncbi:MAG TPA: porin family protein [Chitinophagaceae bacterium]|nr:porin family protein [Chitinophagaceae bacterium]
MKKNILLSIAFTLVSVFAFSQKIRIGISPGLALSRGSYEPSAGIDRRIYAGFDGGLLIEFRIVPKISLQPELNYSMVGVELNNGTTERTIKLRYVTVPLLLKISPAERFHLMAGPQLGFLTAAINVPSGTTGSKTDIKDDFKSTDLDLIFGLEYRLISHIFLGARYSLGLSQIAVDDAGFTMKNRSLSFRIVCMLGSVK